MALCERHNLPVDGCPACAARRTPPPGRCPTHPQFFVDDCGPCEARINRREQAIRDPGDAPPGWYGE